MRTPEEMFDLLLKTAREDERILAVMLNGSRSNPEAPQDIYQDYDIVYFVKDLAPFWNNKAWLEGHFGKVLLMQTPEANTLIPPNGNGDFIFLAIFEDGVRIDLTITSRPYIDNGEPAVILLDKTGMLSHIRPDPGFWHIKKPTEDQFFDCCNEFWWCLNNVAKGLVRCETVYVMDMLNKYVRNMLNTMAEWYIGVDTDFSVSPGKAGKYFGKYLDNNLYRMYLSTYSPADGGKTSALRMMDLFSFLAHTVAGALDFRYCEEEEQGLRKYFSMTLDENPYRLLEYIKELFSNALGENLVGIYLYGSLASGCFNWQNSDIDFIAVTHREPEQSIKEQIILGLLEFERIAPPKGIEMSIVPKESLKKVLNPAPYFLHYSKAHSDAYRKDLPGNAAKLCGLDYDLPGHYNMIKAAGKAILGEPIENVFGKVAPNIKGELK